MDSLLLSVACESGDYKRAKQLIERGTMITLECFLRASECDQRNIVRLLYDRSPEVIEDVNHIQLARILNQVLLAPPNADIEETVGRTGAWHTLQHLRRAAWPVRFGSYNKSKFEYQKLGVVWYAIYHGNIEFVRRELRGNPHFYIEIYAKFAAIVGEYEIADLILAHCEWNRVSGNFSDFTDIVADGYWNEIFDVDTKLCNFQLERAIERLPLYLEATDLDAESRLISKVMLSVLF